MDLPTPDEECLLMNDYKPLEKYEWKLYEHLQGVKATHLLYVI